MLKWLQRLRGTKDAIPAPPSPLVSADIPIRGAAQDLLSRAAIANRIADTVTAPGAREGRVFAIRGGWGNGKSSLKNLVIEAFASRNPSPLFLEFNPWQWGDSDAIARALFEQMASRLGGAYSPEATRRAKALRRYGDLLIGSSGTLSKAGDEKGLVEWLAAAALIFGALGIGFTTVPAKMLAAAIMGLSGLALLIGKILRLRGEDRSAAPLDTVRADLEKRLAELERPLVVFVDDIDRLEPEQIRALFRQIKVNANLPNILFVLLFQPSIVEEALKPVAHTEGRDYLEKIVQAHFDLPPVAPEKLMQIFALLLGAVVDHLATSENGFEQRRWGNVSIGGIQPFIRNLRDVRRLMASIEIHLPLYEGRRVFEANIIDFIALEALRVFEPQFHAALAQNEALLLQTRRFRQDGAEKIHRERIEALIDRVRPERQDACRSLLKELFPPIEWALGGMHYSGESFFRGWLTDKRVCTSRHFGRYFTLQLPEGSISESDFADLVEAATDQHELDAIIDIFRKRGALGALAARFDESVEQLPIDDIERLLPALFNMGEELSGEPGSDGPFNSPFVSAWRAASWYLRRVPDMTERARLMLQAMASTKALSTPAILISLEIEAYEKPDSEREPELAEEDIGPLKEAWIANMEERIADPALLQHDRLVSHLFRWKEYAGSDEPPRAWVAEISGDASRRVKLLRRFLSVGRTHGWGDRVSVKTETFRKDSLEPFFDLDDLRAWVGDLDLGKLEAEDARVMAILAKILGMWHRGEATER